MKRAILTTASLLVGLGVALPVLAQGGGPGPDRPPHARSCDDMNARLAGSLAFTEAKLKITDQQRAAWTVYADAMKANQADRFKACQEMVAKHKEHAEQADKAPKEEQAEKGERRGPHHRHMAVPVTERMAKMEERAAAQLKYVQTLRPAVSGLYDQLTPEQKVEADRLLVRGDAMFGGPRSDKRFGARGHDHGGKHERGHGGRDHGGPGGHGGPGSHGGPGPQGGPGVPPKG